MSWPQNPFAWMSLINVCSGLFSAIVGLRTALMENATVGDWEEEDSPSPWRYFLGGLFAALVGVGNWFQWSLATWGTIGFIMTSVYDGWFGPGSKDWRFFTLSAYILVQTALVLWSTQLKSLFSLP